MGSQIFRQCSDLIFKGQKISLYTKCLLTTFKVEVGQFPTLRTHVSHLMNTYVIRRRNPAGENEWLLSDDLQVSSVIEHFTL